MSKELLKTFDEKYFECLGCKKSHEIFLRRRPPMLDRKTLLILGWFPPGPGRTMTTKPGGVFESLVDFYYEKFKKEDRMFCYECTSTLSSLGYNDRLRLFRSWIKHEPS